MSNFLEVMKDSINGMFPTFPTDAVQPVAIMVTRKKDEPTFHLNYLGDQLTILGYHDGQDEVPTVKPYTPTITFAQPNANNREMVIFIKPSGSGGRFSQPPDIGAFLSQLEILHTPFPEDMDLVNSGAANPSIVINSPKFTAPNGITKNINQRLYFHGSTMEVGPRIYASLEEFQIFPVMNDGFVSYSKDVDPSSYSYWHYAPFNDPNKPGGYVNGLLRIEPQGIFGPHIQALYSCDFTFWEENTIDQNDPIPNGSAYPTGGSLSKPVIIDNYYNCPDSDFEARWDLPNFDASNLEICVNPYNTNFRVNHFSGGQYPGGTGAADGKNYPIGMDLNQAKNLKIFTNSMTVDIKPLRWRNYTEQRIQRILGIWEVYDSEVDQPEYHDSDDVIVSGLTTPEQRAAYMQAITTQPNAVYHGITQVFNFHYGMKVIGWDFPEKMTLENLKGFHNIYKSEWAPQINWDWWGISLTLTPELLQMVSPALGNAAEAYYENFYEELLAPGVPETTKLIEGYYCSPDLRNAYSPDILIPRPNTMYTLKQDGSLELLQIPPLPAGVKDIFGYGSGLYRNHCRYVNRTGPTGGILENEIIIPPLPANHRTSVNYLTNTFLKAHQWDPTTEDESLVFANLILGDPSSNGPQLQSLMRVLLMQLSASWRDIAPYPQWTAENGGNGITDNSRNRPSHSGWTYHRTGPTILKNYWNIVDWDQPEGYDELGYGRIEPELRYDILPKLFIPDDGNAAKAGGPEGTDFYTFNDNSRYWTMEWSNEGHINTTVPEIFFMDWVIQQGPASLFNFNPPEDGELPVPLADDVVLHNVTTFLNKTKNYLNSIDPVLNAAAVEPLLETIAEIEEFMENGEIAPKGSTIYTNITGKATEDFIEVTTWAEQRAQTIIHSMDPMAIPNRKLYGSLKTRMKEALYKKVQSIYLTDGITIQSTSYPLAQYTHNWQAGCFAHAFLDPTSPAWNTKKLLKVTPVSSKQGNNYYNALAVATNPTITDLEAGITYTSTLSDYSSPQEQWADLNDTIRQQNKSKVNNVVRSRDFLWEHYYSDWAPIAAKVENAYQTHILYSNTKLTPYPGVNDLPFSVFNYPQPPPVADYYIEKKWALEDVWPLIDAITRDQNNATTSNTLYKILNTNYYGDLKLDLLDPLSITPAVVSNDPLDIADYYIDTIFTDSYYNYYRDDVLSGASTPAERHQLIVKYDIQNTIWGSKRSVEQDEQAVQTVDLVVHHQRTGSERTGAYMMEAWPAPDGEEWPVIPPLDRLPQDYNAPINEWMSYINWDGFIVTGTPFYVGNLFVNPNYTNDPINPIPVFKNWTTPNEEPAKNYIKNADEMMDLFEQFPTKTFENKLYYDEEELKRADQLNEI